MPGVFNFTGHGANVVGSLGSGSLVQDMPYDLSFDGDGDWVLINDQTLESTFQDSFTLSAWVKPFDPQNGEQRTLGFLGTWATSIGSVAIQTNGKVTFTYSAGGNSGMASTADAIFAAGQSQWRHILCTADETIDGEGGLQIYVDGAHATLGASGGDGSSGSTAGVTFGDFVAPTNCYVQGAALNNDYEYSGSIRDLSLWSTKLTDSQIIDVFKGDLSSTDQELWWKLDDNSATANDSTSNNRDGTVTNGTWSNSEYNLNQIGSGSVSGATTISGGTWNLRDSTYLDFHSNGYASLPSLSAFGTDDYTVTGWFNTDAGSQQVYFTSGPDTNDNFFISIDPDGGYLGLGSKISWVHQAYTTISQDEWHQFVLTRVGTVSKWYLDGVLVGTGTDATDWENSTTGYLGQNGASSQWYQGGMRGVRIYDTGLTQAQVDLLYKGQWDGEPTHWWKLNEGTGNAEDSGQGSTTASVTAATWLNPDYDIDGVLLINSGTTTSAPRANFIMSAEGDTLTNYGTYTHNSGTVVFDQAADVSQKINGPALTATTLVDPVLYNLTHTRPANSYHMYTYGTVTVQNRFYNSGGYYNLRASGAGGTDATLILGTTTTSGTYESGWSGGGIRPAGTDTGKTVYVYGASQFYPAIITGSNAIDWDNEGPATEINIKWIDYVADATTGGGGTTITLDGDCEFDKLTISAGDTLDLNGQRIELAGQIYSDSGYIKDSTGGPSQIWTSAGINYNSTSYIEDLTTTDYIQTAVDTHYIQGYPFKNIFMNGTGAPSFGKYGPNFSTTNLIIGNCAPNNFGSFSEATGTNLLNNITIGSAGTLNATGSPTLKCSGNFNMAGGLIGKHSLYFDGVDEYMDTNASFVTTFDSTFTLTGWFMPEDATPSSEEMLLAASNDSQVNHINMSIETDARLRGFYYCDPAGALPGSTVNLHSEVGALTERWHHYAFTVDSVATGSASGSAYLYLDGKLVDTTTHTFDMSDYTASADLTIGVYNRTAASLSGFYNGKTAQTSIWGTALTEAEIREMMFYDWAAVSGSSIDQTDCVAWYEFNDDVAGTTVSDMSGNDNTGTMQPDNGGWANVATFTYDESTLAFTGIAGETQYLKGQGSTSLYNMSTSAANVILDNKPYVAFNINETLILGSGTLYGDNVSGSNYTSVRFRNTGTSDDYAVCLVDGIHRGNGPDADVPDGMAHIWGGGTIWYGNYMQVPAGTYAGMTAYGAVQQVGDIISYRANGSKYDTDNIGALSYYGRWDTNGYDILSCEGLYSNETGSQWTFGAGTNVYFRQDSASPTTWGFQGTQTGQYNMNGIAGANFNGVGSSGRFVMNSATDIGRGSVFKGSCSISFWVYLPADMQPTLNSVNGGFFGGGGGGQTNGGMDLWTYEGSSGDHGSWYFDINGETSGERSSASQSIVAGDLGKLHHIVCIVNRTMGVATGDGEMIMWQSIVGEDATPQKIASGSVTAPFDGISNTKTWSIGYAGLDYWPTSGRGPIISDFRIWKGGDDGVEGRLTDAEVVTLYNGGDTIINGTATDYPDSDNSLNANTWYKLDRTDAGLASLVDSVSGNNATYNSTYTGQTGFVTFQKADPAGDTDSYKFEHDANYATNAAAGTVTLTNTYVSGSEDIILADGNVLHTKGTVVLD